MTNDTKQCHTTTVSRAALRASEITEAIRSPKVERVPSQRRGVKPPIAPRVTAYLGNCAQIPEHPVRAGMPYFHQIGQEIGCSAQLLADMTKPHRARIEKHARQHGFRPATISPRRRARPVEPRLMAHLDTLRSNGQRVPASHAHPTEPAWNRIGEAVEVEGWVLASPKFPYRQIILDFVDETGGVAPIVPVRRHEGPVTLRELGAAMRRDREAGVYDEEGQKSASQHAKANDATQTALRHAADAAPAGMEAAAGPAIAAATAALDRPKKRRLASELTACAKALESIETHGLPASFAGALDFAIGRVGLPLAAVARETDIGEYTLRDWASGGRAPPRAQLPKVAELEVILLLSSGALTTRYVAKARQAKPSTLRQKARRGPAPGPRRSPHGPALQTLFPRDWPLRLDPTDRPIYERTSKWPEQLRHERDTFFSIKSLPQCPTPYARRGDLWSAGTLTMRDSELGRLFTYIAQTFSTFEGNIAALSFALLVFPDIVKRFIKARSSVRIFGGGVGRLTTMDIAMLRYCRAMVEKKTGFLRQLPEFANRLVALADPSNAGSWIISPEQIAEAKAKWAATCNDAFKTYSVQITSDKKAVVVGTDHSNVETILRLDDPFRAFRMGRDGLVAEIQTLPRGSVGYCVVVRDLLLWCIGYNCGFREENYDFSWTPNNQGEFRLFDTAIEIVISRLRFKNKNGPYFKLGKDRFRDYFKRVDDDTIFLWAAREWIGYCRPLLLRGRHSDRLFIANDGDDLAASGSGQALMGTYTRYVMWNAETETGIVGALSTGPHAIRAILATSVYKETGNPLDAAEAIHDSVQTVLAHYAVYVNGRAASVQSAVSVMRKRKG